MYIVAVLIEHPVQALDCTFDYLSYESCLTGVRVYVSFNRKKLVGYVTKCTYTNKTKQQLEQEAGFKYQSILEQIDQQPLLNQELQILASNLSKLTLVSKIACLQAMVPTQLKPKTTQGSKIQYETMIELKDASKNVITKKQQEALRYIKNHTPCYRSKTPYSKTILDNLEKQGAIRYYQVEKYREVSYQEKEIKEIHLNREQQLVVDGITSKINQHHVALLHGVTGSGKTQVYIELTKKCLENNKTILMLVPEISLTPMMISIFKSYFGTRVAILHSKLSNGQRYDEYRRIINQEVSIVVGARSAIFAPVENIGLIILDEEHDSSYKQTSRPCYYTHQIALLRAKYHQAPLLLASATPSIESYTRALNKEYDFYEMKQRANHQELPEVEFIDMTIEIKQGNYSILSRKLKQRLQETIDRNHQAIILLNKRGYSSIVRCIDCGHVIKCPHCDVTLTYHKQSNALKCHYCDYQQAVPTSCPTCQSTQLKFVGTGTQKVEELLSQEIIGARVVRYDVDTTRNKGGHEKILEQFEHGEANILLGTQMVAKGLDFENVTFVGVLNADTSLQLPDYRCNEKTFSLLEQVAGRAGRSKKEGSVLIQTYDPKNPVLQAVKQHDYQTFYYQEINYRKLATYPPFCFLVAITIESKDEYRAITTSNDMKNYLQNHCFDESILGPANCSIYRLNDYYRRRIMIKYRSAKKIYPVLSTVLDFYKKEKNVRVSCDFNPYTHM